MSQVDFDITTADANTGVTFRAAVNAALQALASNNSGIAAPGTTYAYQFWVDTSGATPVLKQRDSANAAWVSLFQLSSNQWLFINDILINGVTVGLGGGGQITNVAFGTNALKTNATGLANVAIGYSALEKSSILTCNTAVGSSALANISGTDGGFNTALGDCAFLNITSGSDNVAIGYAAGRYSFAGGAVTVCYQSVFIGDSSKPLTNGSSVNEIAIGYDVSGNGSNTATLGNTSITKTILRGEVVAPALTTGLATRTTATYTVPGTITSIIANYAGIMTLTLPAAATYPGRIINLKTILAQTVISASANVVPLVGGAAGTAILSATAGKWATLQSDGTNWQIMAAN